MHNLAEILAEEETAWDALRTRIGRAWYEVAYELSGWQKPPQSPTGAETKGD